MILDWGNLIEDIRIERRGIEQFPFTSVKMHDLQDFVLRQEHEGRLKTGLWSPLSTVSALFRDAGLGYATDTSMAAKDFYFQTHPAMCDLVLNGDLRPLLDEAIALTVSDDLGHLRLAMDVVAKISHMSNQKKTQSAGDTKCPNCGADPKHLTLKPHPQTLTPVVHCALCGHEQEVDPGGDPSGGGENSISPGDSGDPVEGSDQGGEDSDSGEESSDQTSSEEGQDSEGDTPSSEGQSEGPGEKGGEDSTPKGSGEDIEKSPNAGGQGSSEDKSEGWDPSVLAQLLMELMQAAQSLGLNDFSSAMEEAVEAVEEEEDADTEGTWEKVWRPYAPSEDIVAYVQPSSKGQEADRQAAKAISKSVQNETSFLQARLRNIIHAVRMSTVYHGFQRGRTLSGRMLVDTFASIRAGHRPKRAFQRIEKGYDVSLAAVVVVDESGSMRSRLVHATKCLMALVQPLDALGCATMAVGFRDGKYTAPYEERDSYSKYHRFESSIIDVFKGFHEPFKGIMWRFANTRGENSTPMSDGIQYALQAISDRDETHRVIFVITDGAPDHDHKPVIKHQLRLAKEVGVHVIGVGIGSGARGVQTLFKTDSVWTDTFEEMPEALLGCRPPGCPERTSTRGSHLPPASEIGEL
jgi:hypothetical protein